MKTQEIIEQVNEAIDEVFKTIPAGFKEYIYESALCYELEKRNIKYYQQKILPFYYKGEYLCSYIPDLLIPTKDGNYVLELKHKASLDDRDKIQLQRYLFGMDERHGSLVNFQTRDIEDYELVPKKHKKEKIVNKAKIIVDSILDGKNKFKEIEEHTNMNRNTLKVWLKKLIDDDVVVKKKEIGYIFNALNNDNHDKYGL